VRLPVGESVNVITSVPFIPRHAPAGPEVGTYWDEGGGGGGAQDDKVPTATATRIGNAYFMGDGSESITGARSWGVTV
jgi:hypothetical protein